MEVKQVPGDGICLFSSLAYIVYGSISRGMDVRFEIVEHVVRHWDRFQIISSTSGGDNYPDSDLYRYEMRQRATYGSTCELMAAGEIYKFRFEVWRNGVFYHGFGEEHYPVRRLQFSGELSGGHFDILEAVSNVSTFHTEKAPITKKRRTISRKKKLQKKREQRRMVLKNESEEEKNKRLEQNRERKKMKKDQGQEQVNKRKVGSSQEIMAMEALQVPGDGNCLFSSLAYIVYGSISRGMDVRFEIVEHVVRHWDRFQIISSTSGGDNYPDSDLYRYEMRQKETYGTTCELMAAGEIYNYRFEVWRNGVFYLGFGEEHYPVRRLRFSGELTGGHFDILESNFNDSSLVTKKVPIIKKAKAYEKKLQSKKKEMRMVLSNETEEEKITRLQRDRERKKMKKDQINELTNIESVDSDQEMIIVRENRKGRILIENIIESMTDEFYCGSLSLICTFCSAKHFPGEQPHDEKFNECCQKGKVDLTCLVSQPYPAMFQNLLTGNDSESKNLMTHIRSFNSALSFASMGAQVNKPPGYGPYCFRIHGQIYHRASTLHPAPGEARKYAQLYILDPDEATIQRMDFTENSGCSETVMKKLGTFINNNNPLAKAYKMLFEVEQEAEAEAKIRGIAPSVVSMAIKHDRSLDQRRYNAPRVNEVAVVFQNTDGEPPFERDLLIHLRPNSNEPDLSHTKRISILHPSLEPMTYPLFFPFGECGWHPNIPLRGFSGNVSGNKRSRVTQMAYFSYRIAVRDQFNQFLSGGKLTQQYLVDAYVKMESNRLQWVKEHQKEIRSESYQGIMDFLHSDAAKEGLIAGKPVILPSSFVGSPRNMQQHYQDAMAIVRKFGKPDLFITMTCNPKWTEITENMETYQTDRPDLVARVFDLKLKELLNDICKRHIFGKVIAKIHVIEFQKRGLPHAHMLIVLDDLDKPRDRDDIDSIVCAEIPDSAKYPRLHSIVVKHMVHGPCGTANPGSPCMENGKCSKDYPKSFQNETIQNLDGYPRYRRRENNVVYRTNKGFEVTNQWIVPYNPYLSLKYNCHINVEVCASVKSVKYLFKYVYKGHDCANIEIREQGELNCDEIKTYVDSRYVSAPEAAWRILAKPMHNQSHTIIRLAVHLPNQQTIYFQENTMHAVANRISLTDSTLMAWFELNKIDPTARDLYYHELPEYFVFSKKTGWSRRKRSGKNTIGRIYNVSLSEGERYYLRLLLLHRRGATSFDDLKTINGFYQASFKDAAKALGLLDDDSVWEETLREAVVLSMPSVLRQLFAYICIFGSPIDTLQLWDSFQEFLVEDLARKHDGHVNGCVVCENIALREIQNILSLHGKKCSDYGLKTPENLPMNVQNIFDILKEKAQGDTLEASLNLEQRNIFRIVMDAIYVNKRYCNCFFLDGPGGSGKTYLYKTLLCVIRGKGDVVLPVASTGIAANLLIGGRTYHSQFKLPIPLTETSTSSIRTNSWDAEQIKESKLIIWDESTMAPSHALNAVDKLLKSLMNNNYPFGGKVILLGGDFRQCLPVVPHAHRAAIVQSSLKYSNLWSKFTTLRLIYNVRAVDQAYSEWLLQMGNGELDAVGPENDIIEIPDKLHCNDCIVQNIFGKNLRPSDFSVYSRSAILCPRNEDVTSINEKVLDLLEGEIFTYLSLDSVECEDPTEKDMYPVEFLNNLTPSGMPPHKLNLKVGAVIMLLRNLNTRKGLCNGTRLHVTSLSKNLICATILTGTSEGSPAFIPRIELAPADPDLPFILRRRQFPVRLAFSITINKAQGQTLEKVGLFLPKPVFSHGQLYVAFSRVRSSDSIKVKIVDQKGQQGEIVQGSSKKYTRNVVFKEVFR